MKLTVEKLLSLEAYKDAKLVGGISGLKNEVSGITIMEDITINEWLRGGETVLTSLLPFKDYDDDKIANFFDTLIHKNISAIIVKLGKAVNEVPEGLIEWGDKRSVAIIQIPRYVFYTDLMYPAMAEVMESQVNKLAYFKAIHEKFREMAIKNYPLKIVVETLAEIIGNPVEIYDKNYNLMISTLKDPIRITQDHRLKYKKLDKGVMYTERTIGYEDKRIRQIMFEISALENTKSYLAIIEINKEVDDLDLLAIENACTNIALIMARNIAIKEVEERFMNDIINDLIFSSPKLSNSLLERANIAGIDLFASYFIVVLSLKCSLDAIKNSIKKPLGSLVKKYKGAYSLKNEQVIIFISREGKGKTKQEIIVDIKNEVKKLSRELEKKHSKICFNAGISNEIKGFENIRKGYDEAMDAIAIGQDLYDKDDILSYDELGIFKIIRDISVNSDVSKYIPKSIAKLLEIDSSRNKELLKTLETYIKTNQHIRLTANELFIHPKTVSYRLDQIKELTGIDFEDGDKLLEIQFAIKILRFLEKNN